MKKFANGKMWDVITKLKSDIFQQNKVLVPNLSLKLVFWFANPSFYLMSPDVETNYALEVVKTHLIVHYVDASPGLTESVNSLLSSSAIAKYYLQYSRLKTYMVSKGDGSFTITDLFNSSSILSEILFVLVKETSFRGSFTKNPYFFQNAKITSITSYIDEEMQPFNTPLLVNFEDDCYSEVYNCLYEETAHRIHGEEMNKTLITPEDFKSGMSIFRLVFSSVDRNILQPCQRSGKLSLELRFSQGVREPYVLLVYAKFPATLEITSSGQVSLKA